MPDRLSGYYLNSLRSWRDDVIDRGRWLKRRHERLTGSGNPFAADQAALIELNKDIQTLIDQAIAEATQEDA
jgi:hypothetical protein